MQLINMQGKGTLTHFFFQIIVAFAAILNTFFYAYLL